MRGCSVSAPLPVCSTPLSTSSNKYAAVQLLTHQLLYFVVETKSRARDLHSQTNLYLSNQGMVDCDIFGLAVLTDGEYLFVDPENKLSKYAPKAWKSSHLHGLDGNGKPLLVLYLCVKFYVDSPLLFRDEVTRHHYYLQLRHNVQLHASSSEELLYLLAGLALQADLGDYVEGSHAGSYFQTTDYFPQQMLSDGMVQTVSALHRENQGLSQDEAEQQYIREASSPEVDLPLHSHLYWLRYRKQEAGQGSVRLAICTGGIRIRQENSTKTLTATFLWNNIGKLCFDRKKFEIRALNWPASDEKFTFYTSSDDKSKQLLHLCRETHQFSMAIQPRLLEVRRREEEERKRYRDCFLFPLSAAKSHKALRCHQRTSVISNTSSNTTSGIVSDRVHSLDESEDELQLEIMINSPPAESVESLALAHLRDDVGPRKQGLDGCSPPPPHHAKPFPNSLGPHGGGAATPATTDGSQCSSSCSTVVVASMPHPAAASVVPVRRASTTSSLELGYSHTAQNSAVSDGATSTCCELDYSVQSAQTSSGIYTLSTTADTKSFHRCGSSIGSVVSASGSFRGDGSDPSAPRSLLTANELSDLIVGRGVDPTRTAPSSDSEPILGRGIYPMRATVSSTLDSNSDYVTLPPPPLPPSRTDSYAMLDPMTPSDGGRQGFVSPFPEASAAFDGDGHRFLPTQNDGCSAYVPEIRPTSASMSSSGNRYHFLQSRSNGSSGYILESTAASTASSNEDVRQFLPSRNNGCSSYIPKLTPASTASSKEDRHLFLSPGTNSCSGYIPESNCASTAASHMDRHFFPSRKNGCSSYIQDTTSPCREDIPPTYTVPASMEEANARFVTTKPHISILTAHTSLVASTAAPSFSAPTLSYHHTLLGPGDASTHPPAKGTPHHDPGANMKPCPMMSIVGKNNYLDVHASRQAGAILRQYHERFAPPPPPILHPRQPPPPPPSLATVYTTQLDPQQSVAKVYTTQLEPQSSLATVYTTQLDPQQSLAKVYTTQLEPQSSLATVYTSQVTRSQIEQFQQQMYSDVDYVIYPMQDPAISKQEYMDAKQGSIIAHTALRYPQVYPPPLYPVYHKGHIMYRSTPNVAGGYVPVQFAPTKYSSNQNLSSEFVRLASSNQNMSCEYASYHSASTSPLYSAAASYSSSSTQSLRFEPHLLPALPGGFPRARSDDNLLNSYEKPAMGPKYRRLPPPPPPPPYNQQVASPDSDAMLDIRTLREKSRNLDLPLISALCNDRSLLKQTNAFVMPRHRPVSWHVESDSTVEDGTTKKGTLLSGKQHSYSKLKYPVSGLSTTQISKPIRKVSACTHTHPHPHHKLTGRSISHRSAPKPL